MTHARGFHSVDEGDFGVMTYAFLRGVEVDEDKLFERERVDLEDRPAVRGRKELVEARLALFSASFVASSTAFRLSSKTAASVKPREGFRAARTSQTASIASFG